MNMYFKVLKNYFGFSGRAGRKEYWTFVIINILISMTITAVDKIVGGASNGLSIFSIISLIYSLGVMIPTIAVGVRRLHDIGKSGKMMFAMLIPIAGPIWLLIKFSKISDPSTNIYGDVPEEL